MVAPIEIATAVLVRDGLVLLAHRHARRQAYPDRWGFVGGHVEPGELPHQAVIRECLEELGVHVQNPLPITMTVSDPGLVMHGFLVTDWRGEPVNAAPEEHDDLAWFRPEDLAELEMGHPETLPSVLGAIKDATSQPRPIVR
ncbi:NUDIX domain-containing protein [Phycicoccus sp. Root101]|uniref:NUDIX domain-containing protein n=1 Tax=Phycicoccus sp. Root101 TaxID=1736421 RepID=UPI000703761A|nr:NUDIX domain-containing protein [Phycicoccus sp. Root101]KQU68495.1 acetyltransferase [Phycicoccus sp. Root101]